MGVTDWSPKLKALAFNSLDQCYKDMKTYSKEYCENSTFEEIQHWKKELSMQPKVCTEPWIKQQWQKMLVDSFQPPAFTFLY